MKAKIQANLEILKSFRKEGKSFWQHPSLPEYYWFDAYGKDGQLECDHDFDPSTDLPAVGLRAW